MMRRTGLGLMLGLAVGWPAAFAAAASNLAQLQQDVLNPDASARWAAVRELAAIADDRAVPPLFVALQDRSRDVREAAFQALDTRSSKAVVDGALPLLDPRGDPGARHMAVRLLVGLEDPRVAPAMVKAMNDPDGNIRQFAAEGLRQAKVQESLGALTRALNDPDDGVRRTAISALTSLDDPAAVPALMLARTRAEKEWRGVIDDTLMRIVAPQNLDLVAQATKDPDAGTRNLAVRLLGQISDPRCYAPLQAALQDADGNVRLGTVESMGKRGDPRAVADLVPLLDSSDALLREAAHKSVVVCAGGDYGKTSRKWETRGTRFKHPALTWHGAWISGRLLIFRALFVGVLAGFTAWLGKPYLFAVLYVAPLVALGLLVDVPDAIFSKQLLTAGALGLLYFWLLDHYRGAGLTWWAVALPGVVILASV